MSEQVVEQPVSTEQPASTEAPASLEDVFKQYSVTEPQETPSPQPQPRTDPQPQAPHIPDPALDPDGFKRYEATRAADSQALRQSFDKLAEHITRSEVERRREREEADIKKAVGFLQEKAPGVDPDVLEVYLGAQAKKDPRLLAVWQNRSKNPKAWDAALKAIGNDAAAKFSIRTDGQLVENQRAMKTAQQHMATAQPEPSKTEQIGKLQGAAFDREFERIRNGG